MLPPIDIGQIPADAAGKLVEGSIADKTTACCEGMKNILEAAGSSITRTVKVCKGPGDPHEEGSCSLCTEYHAIVSHGTKCGVDID